MQFYAAFMPRNSVRQAVRPILTALVLVSAACLLSARLMQAQDTTLIRHWATILGPVEVHLIFTDPDGKQQDYSLAEAPQDFISKLTPRLQAESKFPLLQPNVRYFDGLWLLNSANVCKEVVSDVGHRMPYGQDNEAYNTSCRPFKYGFMSAYIDPQAPDYFVHYNSEGAEVIPVGGYPTGTVQQLQIGLSVPLNIVPFTVTSPCTCSNSNLTCNKDPDFTMAFNVTFNVVANSTESNEMKFNSNPQMQIQYYAGMDALGWVSGKAFEKQVADLESSLEQQLATDVVTLASTGDLSIVTVIAQLFYDLAKYGIGGLYEATCDSNLYNTVSSYLAGEFNTPTVVQMANTASAAFKTLFLAIDSASELGFTKLEVVEGSDHGLQFRLTYPAPAKPDLKNAIAAANKGIHLTPPSIGTGGQQIKPGVPFMVSGSNFPLPSVDALDVSWNHTVAGVGPTKLEWGPKGGTTQTIPVVGDTYRADNLKPSTAYQFRVQECDTITCSPWSDWLEASTESGTSSAVKVWLDDDTAHSVGTSDVGPDGGFLVKVTVPDGTTAGNHTINAATTGDNPEASAQITVAGQGGASATIAVMNTSTHTAFAPPVVMMNPSSFRLRGDGFKPGATVTLHLDTDTGPQLGTAVPNAAGIFLSDFNLPYSTSGIHKLVAIQGSIQASEDVELVTQPK